MSTTYRFKADGTVHVHQDGRDGETRSNFTYVLAHLVSRNYGTFANLVSFGTLSGICIQIKVPESQKGAARRCRKAAERRDDWKVARSWLHPSAAKDAEVVS